MATSKVRHVAILAAHEPDLDPRVDWIAGFAPDHVAPTVFGIFDVRRERPSKELRRNRYRIERFVRNRAPRRESIFWLLDLVKGRNFSDFCKLCFLLLTGMFFDCPAMLLWAPVAGIRRVLRYLEKIFFSWLLEENINPIWHQVRQAYLAGRRIFESVFMFFFSLRQKYQFRPNRLVILLDVAQYFYATTEILVPAVQNSADNFEVIHCNDLETLFAGVRLKSLMSCRLIYDAHEFWPHSDVSARWWEIKFWEIVERNLLIDVDRAFTVSSHLADAMSERYRIKFETLPNSEPFESGRPSAAVGNKPETTFVFQGGFAEKRGIDFLLKAWAKAKLPNARLILRGPDSEVKETCIRIAQRLGLLDESVFFMPSVDEAELLNSLENCDVGIIPYEPYGINYRFCCPNKLSQYMKCGLPVLHNELPYVDHVVSTAKAGWKYDSRDLNQTVKTLKWIVANPSSIAQSGDNARRYFEEKYNWQVVSTILYNSYESQS